MIVQSIIIDNTYGKNVTRVSIYGKEISDIEGLQLNKESFQVMIDPRTKEYIQSKIENLIQENIQISYIQTLLSKINKVYYVYYTFTPDFFIMWKSKDKTVDFKENFKI